MKIAIYYFSKSGSTKKIAEAIGAELNVVAKPINDYQEEKVDYLFVGGSLKADSIDKKLKSFLLGLNPELINKVVIFGTSATGMPLLPAVKKVLGESKPQILEDNFICKGKFLFTNKGRPSEEDCNNAKVFASTIINEQ